jgi:4-alpha-glucanotransferase
MSPASRARLLHQLARLYGVQTAYYDVSHRRQRASVEALLAVLKSLGAPVATLRDVPSAWRDRQQELWQRLLEPVAVVWDNEPPRLRMQLPLSDADAFLDCHLKLETGDRQRWKFSMADMPIVETAEIEGTQYVAKQLLLPEKLPWGYHRLTLEMPRRHEEALIISAPLNTYLPQDKQKDRMWGVFLPLYALHTKDSWGAGDFSDFEALISWLAPLGAQVVAMLPFLATFLDEFFEPSPYLPVSRRLWNEFYLDIDKVPEIRKCPSAQALLESSPFQKEIKTLRNSSLVDYRRQMALKRHVLEELCRCFFAEPTTRLEVFHHFIEANPIVEDYARFRATFEKQRTPWRSWPQPLREGVLKEGDYNEENRRYHLYVQWLAHLQIESVLEKAEEKGLQLYLDLPMGVHPDGYDAWREHDSFILGTFAGAPPDIVFTKGQNWEFSPPHPEKIRERGYRYTIAYLRHHLQHAGILRIDHVMGLHRLFCIPNGMEAREGVYVRYRPEELYAILALESHRNKTIIVGEDLGTVPSYVRPAMKQHELHRLYVMHYELAANRPQGLPPIPRNSVVSLNTHDMPPFAAFWQGLEVEERLRLGLVNKAGMKREKREAQNMKRVLTNFLLDKGWLQESEENVLAVLKACLAFLAASKSRIVIVNLEDLWLETQPQNVPSTKTEYLNWQRKARYSLEAFCQMPQVVDTLRTINKLRKQSKHQ